MSSVTIVMLLSTPQSAFRTYLMNVQISHRSLANLELVDAFDTGKQVACPVCIARSAMCHADSLCFGMTMCARGRSALSALQRFQTMAQC